MTAPAAQVAKSRGYSATKELLHQCLTRVEGQVRGISRMVDDDRYCTDAFTQISAAQAALDKIALALMDEHAHHCVMGASTQELQAERTDELMSAVGRLIGRNEPPTRAKASAGLPLKRVGYDPRGARYAVVVNASARLHGPHLCERPGRPSASRNASRSFSLAACCSSRCAARGHRHRRTTRRFRPRHTDQSRPCSHRSRDVLVNAPAGPPGALRK